MSKKLSEADRYNRMKKLEREAEVIEKRKVFGGEMKQKGGRAKIYGAGAKSQYHYNALMEDDIEYYMK